MRTVIGRNSDQICFDTYRLEQRAHERRLVLAITIIFREDFIGSARRVSAPARYIERNRHISRLLNERRDGADLFDFARGLRRQLRRLRAHRFVEFGGGVNETRQPRRNRSPVFQSTQACRVLGRREVADRDPWRHCRQRRTVLFLFNRRQIAQLPRRAAA